MPADTANTIDAPVDRYVLEHECKTISRLSRSTRQRMIRAGKFPKMRRISTGRVGWLLSELKEWLQSCEQAA